MSATIYDINFKKIIKWWTPAPMRKAFWLTLLGILVKPIVDLYNALLRFRKAMLYELSITPQVCYLEALLNNRYDFTSRRIYIGDPIDKSPLYLFTEAESKPVYLFTEGEDNPLYLYTDGEGAQNGDDFIIWVPVSITFDQLEMRSLVNKFKLAGMKFKIQTF